MSYVVQCPPGARVSQGKLEGHAPSWPCTEYRRLPLLGQRDNRSHSVHCVLVSWWSVHSTWVPLRGRPAAAPRADRGHHRARPSKTRRPRRSVALQVQQCRTAAGGKLLGMVAWRLRVVHNTQRRLCAGAGAGRRSSTGLWFRGNIELANARAISCHFPTTGCGALVVLTPNCCGFVGRSDVVPSRR